MRHVDCESDKGCVLEQPIAHSQVGGGSGDNYSGLLGSGSSGLSAEGSSYLLPLKSANKGSSVPKKHRTRVQKGGGAKSRKSNQTGRGKKRVFKKSAPKSKRIQFGGAKNRKPASKRKPTSAKRKPALAKRRKCVNKK